MPLTRPLSESVVVITGASSGIGAATALALAHRGARLVLAARGEPALHEVAERCRRLGADALPVPTDVAEPDQVARLAEAAEERFGRIDAWVNGAAVVMYGRLLDAPLPDLRRAVDIDLFGYLYGARIAVPRMRAAGGGVLVMVSSVLGETTAPYLGAYTISKHALIGLADTLRQELRADGVSEVSVCTVLPSSVDTPLFQQAANRVGRLARPLPPVIPPSRVAERIVRLIESPRRQAHVGFAATALSWQWRLAPGLTERLMGRYAQVGGFVRGRLTRPTTGNLYRSRLRRFRTRGGWQNR
jgi:NAD(P)-dependent dehydrogenase (short-subunit alcohol dehydrogenase family)